MTTFNPQDTQHMQRALELAWQGRFSTSPNPRVGCVIAHGSQIVGQGFHVQAGSPHAEVHAIRQAGELARGATAYVTLEPCSHYGRTPPCAEGLIAAGVSRVVAAMTDPNPLVAGKGLAMLQAAGIAVEQGLLEHEARQLNRGFLSRIERNRPFVSLKIAASLDGKTALSNGQSQWITGAAARADVQIQRAQSCAVLTGIGTVLADNPRLNVRDFPTVRQPLRVVLDSQLRTPKSSHIIQDGQRTLIITTSPDTQKFATYANVEISKQPAPISLPEVLHELAQRGIGELMIEAGSHLASAFLQQDLLDEIVYYQAPKLLGDTARGAFLLPENDDMLRQNPAWQTVSLDRVGDDIKWVLQKR
ncbi:bifunctional diaminohydroxyphosphoribosylaminopyrimidine deaminase/5-amino-6-(5-phosphoribosylamino)uracil reductase RibD [Kingella kingae]|uniref:bifunctional diaminohydroxyphosphoribosylaminopyrimidine deaminase/5-amino-6-(5-phosphoribosylamino)uracil reductase RibD n=1 Tax=Kingella kingae TaxID=504 RepID=UPI00070654D9|nr:bifunctional diaminohydroxyphosphoribosylaminopyrimidine deaminase/5-amino-6-(5-phosphoribosylamino)uracil reductase RibD [Kingella kingae]MDK4584791.1 bifunctional diaminohydroxyphosphoribosylaminopyrimidine deaminase/5-amino-6-(5-phosphoribosylamino)uracil reductase RibD [Kingella kingae]MDK4588846.1 bifunctional diaminohydroxyphosphoribosylaminopyrimidine deaminase/5-amino-6-(5-phosphoribosylamino)uracil reductase RibD [Kingella kingae]MDK4610890.1 bifunctional diaminohydroxyphosphoribosyl